MVNLERAIYSIVYYWHGTLKRGVPAIIWLFDKVYNLELYSWSTVNNLPYNQTISDKIEEMITNNDLRVTNRWKPKFGNSGLEPIQTLNSPKLYKPSERFSENFRMTVNYYLYDKKAFKNLYNEYKDKPMNKQKFFNETIDFLIQKMRD